MLRRGYVRLRANSWTSRKYHCICSHFHKMAYQKTAYEHSNVITSDYEMPGILILVRGFKRRKTSRKDSDQATIAI